MTDTAPDFDLEYDQVVQDPKPKITSEDDLPDKYKGKTAAEIAEMHLNAERALSKQGQELSQLRKLTDEILEVRKDNAKAPEKPVEPVTPDEVFADPNAAVEKIIRNSEVSRKVENTAERIEEIERNLGQREFETKHPSYMDDAKDPEFLEWVQGNRARTELLSRLHFNYDFQAGNDLWEMWEERKTKQAQADDSRREKLRAAKTVKSGPADTSSKPVYSRAKLLELQIKASRGDAAAKAKWNDPAFQQEYIAAYAEGRVR